MSKFSTQKTTTPKDEKTIDATSPVGPIASPAEGLTSEPKASVVDNVVAVVGSLSDGDLNATLKTLRTELRKREKEREALRPRAGSQVRILRGRPKYVGQTGTAIIVARVAVS